MSGFLQDKHLKTAWRETEARQKTEDIDPRIRAQAAQQPVADSPSPRVRYVEPAVPPKVFSSLDPGAHLSVTDAPSSYRHRFDAPMYRCEPSDYSYREDMGR